MVANIAKKLDRMPLDRIGNNLGQALERANSTFRQLDTEIGPQARETLASAQESFRMAQATLREDSPFAVGHEAGRVAAQPDAPVTQ